jgi:hypothetical protein
MGRTAFLAAVLVAALTAGGSARQAAAAPPVNDALRTLPPGDMIATVKVDAVLNQATSTWLSGNADSLRKFNESLSKAQLETGVDFRQVREMALSATFPATGNPEFAAVLTGSFDAARVTEAIKASKAGPTARTEAYGGATLHVFPGRFGAAGVTLHSPEMAVAVLDANTAVVGSLPTVRAAIDVRAGRGPNATSDAELMEAYNQADATGAGRFALKMPEKMLRAEMEKDPNNLVLKNLTSVRYVFGSLGVAPSLTLKATARTGSPAEAKPIYDALNGLLAIGRMAIAGKPDLASMMGIFDRTSLTTGGPDVMLVIDVPAPVLQDALKPRAQTPAPAA